MEIEHLKWTESMSCTTSILLWDLSFPLTGCPVRSETWEIFPKTEAIRSHNSRAGKPSSLNPVSREIISDSVELWETDVCILAHPTYWNKCMTCENAQCSSRSGFWIFKISRKVRVQKQSQSALLSSISHMTILFVFTRMMNIYEINRFRRLSQALVHFVIDRASLLTDDRISSRPIRAKFFNFRTIWEHTCDNSPTDFISSL